MTPLHLSRPILLTLTFALALGCAEPSDSDSEVGRQSGDSPSDGGHAAELDDSNPSATGSATAESERDDSASPPEVSPGPESTESTFEPTTEPELEPSTQPETEPGGSSAEPSPTAPGSQPAASSSEPEIDPEPSTPPASTELAPCGDACTPDCPCAPEDLCLEIPVCDLDCVSPVDENGCVHSCECDPPLSAEEVCSTCGEDTRCVQHPREDGEWEYVCAPWEICKFARACACIDPAFGYCELAAGNGPQICVCSGPDPAPPEGECQCDPDATCIYQVGGPGAARYQCVTQAPNPCNEDDQCGCLDSQGTCAWDPLIALCSCDNGLD